MVAADLGFFPDHLAGLQFDAAQSDRRVHDRRRAVDHVQVLAGDHGRREVTGESRVLPRLLRVPFVGFVHELEADAAVADGTADDEVAGLDGSRGRFDQLTYGGREWNRPQLLAGGRQAAQVRAGERDDLPIGAGADHDRRGVTGRIARGLPARLAGRLVERHDAGVLPSHHDDD